MTADEIRKADEMFNGTDGATAFNICRWAHECALQLALGNERLERIATALEAANLRNMGVVIGKEPMLCPTCAGTGTGTNTTSGVCRTCWGRKTL